MRKLALAAAAALIAGCTSIPEEQQMLSDFDPVSLFETAKAPDVAAECVRTNLSAVADSMHTVVESEDGETRIVRVTTRTHPNVVVRVTPAPGGSSIDYRSRQRLGYGRFANAVAACR